jgi:hypothetical protein
MKGMREGMKWVAALCLGSAAIFLASCEKEVLSEANGNIRVNFTLDNLPYEEQETAPRSAKTAAEETVVTPLENNTYMYATLREEMEEPLRALQLPGGTKLVIAAYNGGGYVDHAEYTVTAAGGLSGSTSLDLPSAGNYRFVAYSLNTTSVTSYAASIGPYSPGNTDLLCVRADNVPIVEGDNNVTLVLKHQFSQVTVVASAYYYPSSPNINLITTEIPGYQASLSVETGSLVKGAAETQTVLWQPFSAASTVTSASRLVYTADDASVSVKVPSVTIGVQVLGPFTAKFNMPLLSGKRYTLRIDFRRVEFAGSNIYWVWYDSSNHAAGGYLTFDAAGSTSNQHYNGVHFKWGSLVGVAPDPNINFDFDNSTKVYAPKYDGSYTWENPDAFSYDYWGDVPYIYVDNDDDWDNRKNTYLSDDERNTPSNWQDDKTGDICRYISENGYGPNYWDRYRMPTSYELIASDSDSDGGTGKSWSYVDDYTSNLTGYEEGVATISFGASNGVIFFPATYFRPYLGNHTNLHFGSLDEGYYWSSSRADYGFGWWLNFRRYGPSGGINGKMSAERNYCSTGIAVRCVKN